MSKIRFGSLDGIHQIKKNNDARVIMISAALFLIIIVAFLWVISVLSKCSVEEQKETLTQAIDKGVVQCYVTEGRYPDSFDYLKENYGIIYDENRFRVDYFVYASNMKPSVTVISLED